MFIDGFSWGEFLKSDTAMEFLLRADQRFKTVQVLSFYELIHFGQWSYQNRFHESPSITISYHLTSLIIPFSLILLCAAHRVTRTMTSQSTVDEGYSRTPSSTKTGLDNFATFQRNVNSVAQSAFSPHRSIKNYCLFWSYLAERSFCKHKNHKCFISLLADRFAHEWDFSPFAALLPISNYPKV